MVTKKDIEKLKELKKKYLEREEIYRKLDNEYFRKHYNTDKEYKALWDAGQAYNSAYNEYMLAAVEIYYRDKEKAEKLLGDL